jgi:hypothetical protein
MKVRGVFNRDKSATRLNDDLAVDEVGQKEPACDARFVFQQVGKNDVAAVENNFLNIIQK